MESIERSRLRTEGEAWKRWGPYLSERQWGTVREDYSADGSAWDYFSHDQARSRAYRWGEDGIAGISDDRQRLCFALAMWNGNDPILKERMFGLTNSEGNHGEDVKEYYHYLDSSPTHSYLKYLYRYPQQAYPYDDLVTTNRNRSRDEMEYELIDTGVFDEDRYFDVFIEYAKASPDDVLVKITAWNRGPDPAVLHLLPTLWFRNTWAWSPEGPTPPQIAATAGPGNVAGAVATHSELGEHFLYSETGSLLFTDNETNAGRLFGEESRSNYTKDAFHEFLIHSRTEAVNPAQVGTKMAAHTTLTIAPGDAGIMRLRLSATPQAAPFTDFDALVAQRLDETDEFYREGIPASLSDDARNVVRQAFAGMLWTKQYYYFDVDVWLNEHGIDPRTNGGPARNRQWSHMLNDDVISMPDKWEYPWYAAWDLAFHAVALAAVDVEFAKAQLDLMLRQGYLHPNGQIPAYEWNFGDVNPPAHAWATMFVYELEKRQEGKGDIQFLQRSFHKLIANFTWWVNRKDPEGRNVFEGGFLGLDNIGVFDRSTALPTGGRLEQADGTAWMALYSQSMLDIAIELAADDPAYEDFVLKFVEHFFQIASSMDRQGDVDDELWDEEDGFFYDLLRLPGGQAMRLKTQSMVGLLPLCATSVIPQTAIERFPSVVESARRMLERDPELTATVASPRIPGEQGRRLFSILTEEKLRRVLGKMLDTEGFLSPHGIRSVSRFHVAEPFRFDVNGQEYRVDYQPAESTSGLFGGNSNWRGPVWFPINILIVRALLGSYLYYGDSFRVECPTGSGVSKNLFEIAKDIADRMLSIFLVDTTGRRPVFGGAAKFQEDPNWRDALLFYEYIHGDNGAGLGASHQTGWTGVIGALTVLFGRLTAEEFLAGGLPSRHAEPAVPTPVG